jgi:hypothetical protein
LRRSVGRILPRTSRLTLLGLDKADEPPSLITLRQQVQALLPRVDLPEVLLEIDARTGFTTEFTHISERAARVSDLGVSLCAVLLAEACNIGLKLSQTPHPPGCPSPDLRPTCVGAAKLSAETETLTRANARLVDAQPLIPLAQAWGGGEVASADGLRFVVPVRTMNAGPNRKYYGAERGVTYYNNFGSTNSWAFMGSSLRGPCAIRCSFSKACSNTRRVRVRWKSWPTPAVPVTSRLGSHGPGIGHAPSTQRRRGHGRDST